MIRLFIGFLFVLPIYLQAEIDSRPLLGRPVASHVRWARDTYDLKPGSQGASMPDGPIRSVSIGLQCDKEVTIEEAREIFVKCVEDLIYRVNADKPLRTWLFDYPFTFRNVDYSISFGERKCGSTPGPFIDAVFMGGGEIIYEIRGAERNRWIEVFSEDYSEALCEIQNKQAQTATKGQHRL